MNKVFTVFLYELKASLRNKSFIITTLFIIGSFIIGSLLLRYFSSQGSNPFVDEGEGTAKEVGLIIEESSLEKEDLEKIFPVYNFVDLKSEKDLEEKLKDQSLDFALLIKNDVNLELVYNIAPAIPNDLYLIEDEIKSYFVDKDLASYDLSLEKIQAMKDDLSISIDSRSLKGNNLATVPITILISVLLYMLIIVNGQMAAMNVAREKNDRTMELLITSTKPSHLINGKVFASFVQSILILLSVALGAFLGFLINKDFIVNILTNMSFNLDPMILIISLIYFIMGYIMYLYIYAALGATVSTTEEISTAVAPISIVVVAVYFATVFALSNPDPNNGLLRILSFIPFSSMFTMHARYALTNVALVEVGISFVILLATTVILSVLSVKLYRSASLNYGNRSKLGRIIKRSLKKKN
ncbi:MAG: ABC transporter permease [Bacillota bacterium]|nr:ABC transporter permease [Bacillota bacterium]